MAKGFLTVEEGAELQRLYDALPAAIARAADAMQTYGQPFEGALLARFMEEDAKVRAIFQRTRELLQD